MPDDLWTSASLAGAMGSAHRPYRSGGGGVALGERSSHGDSPSASSSGPAKPLMRRGWNLFHFVPSEREWIFLFTFC